TATICSLFDWPAWPRRLPSFPTRRSSDLPAAGNPDLAGQRDLPDVPRGVRVEAACPREVVRDELRRHDRHDGPEPVRDAVGQPRSEEHTSELQSPDHLVCRLLLEKKKQIR